MPSGVGIDLTHIRIAGLNPSDIIGEPFDDGFRIGTAAKTLNPVLLPIERTEDGGGGIESPLREFKDELDVLLGQILDEPFVKDEHFESRIFVKNLRLSSGERSFVGIFRQKLWKPYVLYAILLAAGFLAYGTAEECLS